MSDEQRISETLAAIEAATSADAVEAIRIEALGKQGWISQALKSLGAMAPEERAAAAPAIQAMRQRVADAIAAKKAALDAAASQLPAVVLLDMLMPVMDGWQCARELRARYGDALPIVIVTAAEHVQERCKEIGADEVLPKPFEMKHLRKIVERYASASRAAPKH